MRRKEVMELERVEKTEIDRTTGRKTVRTYRRAKAPWISREVLKWVTVIGLSLAIGIRWGLHM